MNRTTRLLLAAAGVTTLAGAMTIDSAGVLPVDAAVAALGNDYFLVAAVGAVALALGLAAYASGRTANIDQTEMPAPERPTSAPAAGSGFDADSRRDSSLMHRQDGLSLLVLHLFGRWTITVVEQV